MPAPERTPRPACYTTLTHKKDIADLFSSGKTYSDTNLRIKFLRNSRGVFRVLFAIPKKSANKPTRNTQIRRMRVIARDTCAQYAGCDAALLICNPDASFCDLRSSYASLMEKVMRQHVSTGSE